MFKLLVLLGVVALVYSLWRHRRLSAGSYKDGPTIDVEPLNSEKDEGN